MHQQPGMNGDANEESYNTNHEVRSAEHKHGSDISRDADMKTAPSSPAAAGRRHPPPTPPNGPTTTPPDEATTTTTAKKSKKRRRIRVRGLKLFNKRGKSLESPMTTTTDNDGRLFGQRLDNICQSQPDTANLPRPIMELLRILYVGGPSVEGIFRRCANKSICRSVRKQLESSGGVDCGPIDVLIASSLLTEFLRKLPDCLLSCEMYDDWLESSLKSDEEERISSLRQLVRHLPACNLLLLRHLICVLHRINRHSDETKMTSCNLGVCLGPSLLWSNTTTLDNQRKDVGRIVTIVSDLIDHASDIFGPDCLHLFRDLESCSITVFSSDQQVDAGIESTDCDSLQRHRGQRSKDDQSTTSRSHANALSPTSSLDPPPSPSAPVAPPRRKRSSVVVPPVFVSIAEESTASSAADHSATPSSIAATMQVLEDRPHFPRSHSSDSASSRDWLGKSYLTETTDGETMEDSDETWATEEDLDGRSEDLVEDDEDSLMASPTVERRKEDGRKDGGGGAPTTVERRNQSNPSAVETKTTKDVVVMDEGNWSNHSTRPRDRISAVDPPPLNRSNALMSFSSTEDSTAGGDRGGGGASGREKSLFFGGSFSSTAGSDADLSNFAESIDSGTAFSESFELQGVIRRRNKMEVNDGESNSSSAVVTMPLQSEDDPRNREINPINRKHPSTKHHRWSEIDVKWDGGESLPVEATAKSSDEHGGAAQAINDSVLNVCEADISFNDSRPLKTDTSGHVHSRKSNQTPDASVQTTLRSRRHSFGCRDQGNGGGGGADIYGSQTRQRRGMTHKGSDVFPGLLSKTLRSRASRMLNPNGLDGKPLSGAKSDNEARGKLFNDPSDRLNSDERIIVSDIEFSESDGKTHSLPRGVDRRTINSCKNPDSPRAARLPLENQDGMQSDKDVVKLENISRTKLMDVNKEDEEKRPSAIRLRLEPPAYDEAVKQLKSQQHSAARVASSTNQQESVLQADHHKEGEQTLVEEKERKQKKQQPVEDCSIRQGKHESVGMIVELDAHALAKLAARSCGDLSKTAVQDGMTNRTNRFPRTELESKLKHVNSLGSLSSGDSLRKRFCIPRSKRWSIRDSSSSSSSNSSNSDDEAALQRRLEDNVLKKRILRKKRRRSRKARNSDTRLQTDRENRVNLVRSKSDSNTLLRELIFKNEDAKHVRETFRTEISRRKETDDQKTFSRDILQNRQTGKENLNQGTVRVRNLEDHDDDDVKLASMTREVNRKKSVGLKDRDWHKDLVREIEFTHKSESSRHPNSVTSAVVPAESEGKWLRKPKDPFGSSSSSSSSNKLHRPTSNNPGNKAVSTLPAAFKCISRIPHGRLLDYSSSDSTKHCIDDAAHIPQRSPGRSSDDSAHGDRRLGGKLNDEASVYYSGTGSGGDGSEGSTANLIELRVNQLRKSDRDFQRGDIQRGDANRSKEVIITTKCPSKEDNTFHMPGNIGVQQKPLQRANTLSLDKEHGNKRNSFKEKTDTQPAREIVAQPVIKKSTDSEIENDLISEKTSSDPNKSSTPLFERISVKDIVAIKNSSSGSAGGRLDPTKPPVPSSFRRGEERTEAWRPETGRAVARRSSHVTPQVKPEVDISLTPELGRRTLPRIEQKPRISLGAQLPMNYPPEIANRLLLPVCGRSPSVKSSNTRETTEVEQRKNAEATSAKLSCQTTASDATTSELNPQRQKHTGVTKSPCHGTPTSSPLSTRSSNESLSRSDGVFSTNPGRVTLLRPDVEVCAFEKGEKRIDCGGESEAGGLDGVPQSHGSGSLTAGKSPRTEMPWSVANLRNRYGNQNPQ